MCLFHLYCLFTLSQQLVWLRQTKTTPFFGLVSDFLKTQVIKIIARAKRTMMSIACFLGRNLVCPVA